MNLKLKLKDALKILELREVELTAKVHILESREREVSKRLKALEQKEKEVRTRLLILNKREQRRKEKTVRAQRIYPVSLKQVIIRLAVGGMRYRNIFEELHGEYPYQSIAYLCSRYKMVDEHNTYVWNMAKVNELLMDQTEPAEAIA